MVKRLVEHVAQLAEDQAGSLALQDVAICATWIDVCVDDVELIARHAGLPRNLAVWAARPEHDHDTTEGRRTQWVLRDLIQRLEQGGLAELQWDELALLRNAQLHAARSVDARAYARVCALLAPHTDRIVERLESLARPQGLPALSARLHVVTEEDLASSPARRVTTFAGIDRPGYGPVLRHDGHVRVLGSVPADCTIVAEGGSCSVDGYVEGRVAARGHCDVRENVCGVVVVRDGEIRARNIIDRAVVVSKRGSVGCREARNPELVYAAREIRVRDGVVLGTLVSPCIVVGAKARGAMLQSSRSIRAERIEHMPSREAVVVLRRELSCEDYGERLTPPAYRALRRARSARRRLRLAGELLGLNEREAEVYALAAILYVCGTPKQQAQAEETVRGVHRAGALRRLCAALQVAAALAEQTLGSSMDVEGLAAPPSEHDLGVFGAAYEELGILPGEEAADREFVANSEEADRIVKRLGSSTTKPKAVFAMLERVREATRTVANAEVRTRAEANALVDAMQREAVDVAFLREAPSELRRRDLLRRLAEFLSRHPSGEPYAARLGLPPVTRMAHWVYRREDRIRVHETAIAEAEQEFRRHCEHLLREFAVVLDGTGELGPSAVTSRFEEGVRIYADPEIVGLPGASAALVTPESGDRLHTYVRDAAGSIVLRDGRMIPSPP